MTTAPLSFLTPIMAKSPKHASLWEKLARHSDRLLACGRHVYVITGANHLAVDIRPASSRGEMICKVLLIATIIIPIFALIIKILDRTFVDYQLSLKFPEIAELATPETIQTILNETGDISAPAIQKLLAVFCHFQEFSIQLDTYHEQLNQITGMQKQEALKAIDYSNHVSLVPTGEFNQTIYIRTQASGNRTLYIKDKNKNGVQFKYIKAAFCDSTPVPPKSWVLQGRRLKNDDLVGPDQTIHVF